MLLEKINKDKLIINIHHVGGIGGYGPTEALNMLRDVRWFVYDADRDSLKASNNLKNKNFKIINKCIGLNNRSVTFYVMGAPSASSIFKTSSKAKNYAFVTSGGSFIDWGEHTHITKSFKVKTRSLDSLLSAKAIPGIDFISIDAQGSEKNILEGAVKSLGETVMGVVTETDFSEIYKDQPLFYHIQSLLNKYNFYLCQIFNNQFWNVSPVMVETRGRGFLAVSESLFLKSFDQFLGKKDLGSKNTELLTEKIVQSLKLAAICVAYDQLDFALKILSFLRENQLADLNKIAKSSGVFYIKLLRDLDIEAKKIEGDADKFKTLIPFEGDNPNYYSFIGTRDKIAILLKFLYGSFLKSLITGKKEYFTGISRVYSNYKMDGLANLHDERVFKYYMFCPVLPYPKSFTDRLLKLILRFNKTALSRILTVNSFSGSYEGMDKTI